MFLYILPLIKRRTKMKPFISLCMIVKNEEKVLERCLTTVAHLIDEVVVVDTGSTDATKTIAQKFTDKVYDFKWVNDFSAARNFAASKATAKWILVLDGDEYVEEENFKEFLNEIRNDCGQFNAYAINIINFIGVNGEKIIHNQHERVYLNDGTITYTRRIHEQLTCKEGEEIRLKKSCLTIYHSGYLNKVVREKEKQERNTQLLDREIEQGNNKAFDYFNYGNQSFSSGNYEEALDFYIKAYNLKEDHKLSWVALNMVNIVNCLIQLKRYDDALNVIEDAMILYETAPDFLYLRSEVFYQKGQYDDAKQILNDIIKHYEYYKEYITGPDVQLLLPSKLLGEIYYRENNYEQAVFYFMSVLNISKYDGQSISRVLTILTKVHSDQEISEFIYKKQLIDENNIVDFVIGCFNVGRIGLAEQILNHSKSPSILLRDIIDLKKACLDETLAEIIIKKEERWESYMQSGLLNWIDLYLINKKVSNIKIKIFFNDLYKDQKYSALVDLLENKRVVNIDSQMILEVLKSCLNYGLLDYVRCIVDYISEFKKDICHKMAAVLHEMGYKIEAMQYYELSGWESMDEIDFIYIIENMLSIGQSEHALQIASYAKSKFPQNFRFYKVILEGDNEQLKELTINDAKRYFINSDINNL